jgi:hypothetical protein
MFSKRKPSLVKLQAKASLTQIKIKKYHILPELYIVFKMYFRTCNKILCT